MNWTLRLSAIVLLSLPCFVMAVPAAVPVVSPNAVSTQTAYVVDDFKDGDISSNPTWWQFGDLFLSVGANTESNESNYVGKQSLHFQGSTTARYVGGCGTYLALDASAYTTCELVIYSPNSESGRLMVELYDDDNRNFVIEPSKFSVGQIAFDDKFCYEFPIDWVGWKKVIIPFFMFYDANPKVGDDIWNPDQKNGSGGLVQMQLIANAVKRRGKVDFKIDSIRFYRDPDSKYILPGRDAEILDSTIDENIDVNIEPRR
jgi:hypothetical protein